MADCTHLHPGMRQGEKNSRAKLTTEQALEIKADPRRASKIAPKYGLNKKHVSRIQRGIAWRHLP